jgi:hypothetical protein
MTAISASNSGAAPQPDAARSSFRLFGIPFGDFGLFASMLIALALGFMAFFGVTFLSIFGLVIYNRSGGHNVPLDMSYKFIALPAGIFVFIVCLAAMCAIWLRRKVTAR